MKRDISRLTRDSFDLLVIGGGINGAAIAHLAQRAGFSTALIEKKDFASGTSSKSTKLIHGGIRYLEHFEFGLVHESLKERYAQMKAAPHLVRPMGFIIPVYKGDKRSITTMRFGVFIYDLLAGRYGAGRHRYLRPKDVLRLVPAIHPERLQGGVLYYDAQMDDARLCLDNIKMAALLGTEVANYVRAEAILRTAGRITGVTAFDEVGKTRFQIQANRIICAGGPWTNELQKILSPHLQARVRTTKGVHIVYEGQISKHALLIPIKEDNRIFFIIPWMGNSLIGTTDTDFKGDPNVVTVEPEDIDYLFDGVHRVFPELKMHRDKIITQFAGLRPLINSKGAPSDVSRKHQIFQPETGLFFVIGGKYTTYRKIAEDCVKKIFGSQMKLKSIPFELYGGSCADGSAEEVARTYGIETTSARLILEKYGCRYKEVLDLTVLDGSLKEKIDPELPFLRAQIAYAAKNEMAQTVDDVVERRLLLNHCTRNYQKHDALIRHLLDRFKK